MLTALPTSPAAVATTVREGRRDDLTPSPATITPTLSDSGFRNVTWMRAQRDVIYAYASNVLRQSTDHGATWNDVHTFTTGYAVHGVRDLDNGELLVSLNVTAGNAAGEVWRSTGYNPSNLAAESWTKVLTVSGTTNGNYIEGAWGMSVYRNIVVLSEYGANKTPPNNARYVYLSTDYGATYTQIRDLGASFTGHVHGCAYDPYDDRIWVTWGDYVQSDATTGRGIAYSDDRGTTWRTITTTHQPTGIIALPNCVLFVSDTNPNGVYRVPRSADKNAIPTVETAYLVDEASTLTWLGSMIFQARYEGAPVLMPFINSGGTARSGLIIATVDGYNFTEIWRDTITYSTTSSGPVRVVGPTSAGKLVGTVKDGRQSANSRLVADAPVWT